MSTQKEGKEDQEARDDQIKQEDSTPDLSDFESIDLALDELRRCYDDEERRREALDNKLNFLLGVNALLISLTVGVSESIGLGQIVPVVFLIISTISVFWGIYLREYERPFEEIGFVYAYADSPSKEFQGEVAELYEDSIKTNVIENDNKQSGFVLGAVFTLASLFMIVLTPVLPIFGF